MAKRVPKIPKVTEDPTNRAKVDTGEGAEAPPVPVDLDVGEEPPTTEALKIVIHMRPSNAMVGVSQPGKDPHLVSLEMVNVQGLEQVLAQVPGIVEVARARWAAAPQYPVYQRPAPPPPAPRAARAAAPPATRTRRGAAQPAAAPPAPVVQAPRMF